MSNTEYSVRIRDDGEKVIAQINHGYKPNDYLIVTEKIEVQVDRDKSAALLLHLIDVAHERRKWVQ